MELNRVRLPSSGPTGKNALASLVSFTFFAGVVLYRSSEKWVSEHYDSPASEDEDARWGRLEGQLDRRQVVCH